jgi:ubiquinone/menaquinone biosynthesis C-methylase UbiE
MSYALENSWDRGERRLRGIEATYDPVTMRRLAARGVGQGWQCLEAGAGAGSIARWLSGQVGRDGTVMAADIDISMLAEMPGNVQVRQLDVATDPLPEAAFDLIHTRLVLNHVAEREMVLDKFAAALRPGGWLLAEEGDTLRAWCDVLAEVADVDLGRRLPGMLSARAWRTSASSARFRSPRAARSGRSGWS